MDVHIEESAITSFFKIPAKTGDKSIYKLQFRNIEEKNEVYRKRMSLREHGDLFLSEDLIPKRNRLAFLCRKLAGAKLIHQTWTYEGKVYVKDSEEVNLPRIVGHERDIKELLTKLLAKY